MKGLIKRIPFAKNVPFDPNGTKFPLSIEDVQAALEYAVQFSEGFPRATVRGTYNSTVGNNSWLGPNELLSNTPFAKFAVPIAINEISFSNQNASILNTLKFYKNGKTAGDLIYTWVITTPNDGTVYLSGLNLQFDAGDKLWVYNTNQGQSPSDAALDIWISRRVI
jgi:hypothetical protein